MSWWKKAAGAGIGFAVGGPVGAAAGLGIASGISESRRGRKAAEKALEQRDAATDAISGLYEPLEGVADTRLRRSEMGTEEMFGPQMQRIEDQMRSSTNATRSAISRSGMATGSDPSGIGAVRHLAAGQNLQQNIGRMRMGFEDRAEQTRQRELTNFQSLLRQAAEPDRMRAGLAQHDRRLGLQQRQAGRQMAFDSAALFVDTLPDTEDASLMLGG